MGTTNLNKTLFKAIVDFVYPPFCLLCDVSLSRSEHLICKSCWETLPRTEKEENESLSGFVPLQSVWRYDEGFQTIVHEMKFSRKSSLSKKMAQEMAELLIQNPDYASADYLIPVPLHKTRLRERGFNQSVLLSRGISKITHIPVNYDLKRVKPTRFQSTLNANQRRQNVKAAFVFKMPEKIAACQVIIVDDVVTTGSTLLACSEALSNTGVKRILALTAARTI